MWANRFWFQYNFCRRLIALIHFSFTSPLLHEEEYVVLEKTATGQPNIAITEPKLTSQLFLSIFISLKPLINNSISPLRVADKENTLQFFLTETNYHFSEHFKPLHSFNDKDCRTGVCTSSLWPRTNNSIGGTW